MINKILSITREKKRIIFNIIGIKLKMRHLFDRRMYSKFLNKNIKPNTILIIEYNECHYETIPGLIKYLINFGFNVDVLTRDEAESVFTNLNIPNLRVYECNEKTFDKIFNNYDFSKYNRIIYNSKIIYKMVKKHCKYEEFDIVNYFTSLPKGEKSNIYLQHHIDKFYETPNDKQIILSNPSKNSNLEKFIVNAHYFRENIKDNDKNEITNFISVGELSNTRRNSSLLIDSVRKLHDLGTTNFKVTIIGKGNLEQLPKEIQPYFNILGRVDYQTMFDEIEKADFILPLLDPDIEAHKRYLNAGTSGTFQLIYGFNKPCLIHKLFATTYDFTSDNSIIYDKNEDFVNAFLKAISINQSEYEKLQNSLKNTVDNIYKISLKNFQGVLND